MFIKTKFRELAATLLCAVCISACATQTDESWAAFDAENEHGDRVTGPAAEASPGDWPTFAALRRMSKAGEFYYTCGGIVIDRYWVLTAAHCFDDYSFLPTENGLQWKPDHRKNKPQFLIGATDLSNGADGEARYISDIKLHPEYKTDEEGSDFDIALVRISTAWDGPYARLLAAGGRSPDDSAARAFIAGHGLTQDPGLQSASSMFRSFQIEHKGSDQSTPAKAGSTELRHAMVKTYDPEFCDDRFKSIRYDSQRMICAGRKDYPIDSCSGDSGGPLQALDDKKRPFLIGLVSFGFTCADPDWGGVYTRISKHQDWIAKYAKNARFVSPTFEKVILRERATFDMLRAVPETPTLLQVAISPAEPVIGAPYEISVTSQISGRLIVFEVSEDGEAWLDEPHPKDPARQIEAGQTLTIPNSDSGESYFLPTPEGKHTIYAVVIPNDVDFINEPNIPVQNAYDLPRRIRPLDSYAFNHTKYVLQDMIQRPIEENGKANWASGKISYVGKTEVPVSEAIN